MSALHAACVAIEVRTNWANGISLSQDAKEGDLANIYKAHRVSYVVLYSVRPN